MLIEGIGGNNSVFFMDVNELLNKYQREIYSDSWIHIEYSGLTGIWQGWIEGEYNSIKDCYKKNKDLEKLLIDIVNEYNRYFYHDNK